VSIPSTTGAQATGVWAVVPVKGFARGKSRLDGVLTKTAREDVARALCEHVLSTLAACDAIEGVLVATDCPQVEAFAESQGALVVRDDPSSPGEEGEVAVGSLALVVDRALGVLTCQGARAALVLMADLPLLAPDDVRALVAALERAPMVVAPDRAGQGTNALGLSPPNRIPTCFGSETSFPRHVARAESEGIALAIHRSEGTAFDLDSPDDLALALSAGYADAGYADLGARLRWNRKRSSRVRAA
jgi:2-phospho-L-lactate guanylyltransferase